jgi:hypothetical protein
MPLEKESLCMANTNLFISLKIKMLFARVYGCGAIEKDSLSKLLLDISVAYLTFGNDVVPTFEVQSIKC